MRYKFSKFNTTYEIDQNILIYNSYSGEISKITKNNKFYDIFVNRDIDKLQELSQIEIEKLKEKRYIVNSEENENAAIKLHINDLIMDNKLVFTILTTEQCNFRCKYCYEKFKHGQLSDGVIDTFIRFIKENIDKYSGVHLRWFGGEPLLGINVIKKISKAIKEICEKNNKIFSSEILTNAYLLNTSTFRELYDLGITQFKITVDGPKEVHDSLRVLANGQGTFDVIFKNLINISKLSKNYGFRIILRSNISKKSQEFLDRYLELLYNNFSKDNRFTFKFKTVDLLEGTNEKNVQDIILYSEEELFDKLIESKYKLNYDIYFEHLKTGLCRASKRNNFVLGADGSIYKCLVYLGRNENKVGKVYENGEFYIDESKLALWLNNYSATEKCNDCPNSMRCFGGKCVANRIFHHKLKCKFNNKHLENVMKILYNNNGNIKIKEI